MTIKKRYNCKTCGFEWYSSEKDYEMSIDCESGEISMVRLDKEFQKTQVERGFSWIGLDDSAMGKGFPKACKCTNCKDEDKKITEVPFRNTKCPECGTKLCRSEYKIGVD